MKRAEPRKGDVGEHRHLDCSGGYKRELPNDSAQLVANTALFSCLAEQTLRKIEPLLCLRQLLLENDLGYGDINGRDNGPRRTRRGPETQQGPCG